jgi:hypothetical protein
MKTDYYVKYDDGDRFHLGSFRSFEEALDRYLSATIEIFEDTGGVVEIQTDELGSKRYSYEHHACEVVEHD